MQVKTVVLALVALAAAGAEAHKSLGLHASHARAHSRLHKRGNFIKAVNPARATGSEDDAGGAGSPVKTYTPFCSGGVSKRATAEEIAYKGNTGTADDYGCNMMEIDPSIRSMYGYTLQITNVADAAYQFVCFNKIGKTGAVNGFFKGMGETVVKKIGPGETATIAIEENSQGGCAFGPGSVPTTADGCYAGSWIEFDMANPSNHGWSGADCSCLVSADTKNPVYGCRVCDKDKKTCSIIYDDGTGENAYTKGTNDLDGVGLNIPPGNLTITLEIGYSK